MHLRHPGPFVLIIRVILLILFKVFLFNLLISSVRLNLRKEIPHCVLTKNIVEIFYFPRFRFNAAVAESARSKIARAISEILNFPPNHNGLSYLSTVVI